MAQRWGGGGGGLGGGLVLLVPQMAAVSVAVALGGPALFLVIFLLLFVRSAVELASLAWGAGTDKRRGGVTFLSFT